MQLYAHTSLVNHQPVPTMPPMYLS
jgi:hypothetical protein